MRKNHKRKVLFSLLKYTLNPFVFISLLGPILIEHNLTMVDLTSYQRQVNQTYNSLLHNDYNYAFTSYNIQLFVLFLAVFFLGTETLELLFKLLIHRGWDNFKKLFEESNWTSFLVIAFITFIIAFIIFFIGGSFASPHIVDLYLKINDIKPFSFFGINTPMPPPRSPITIWRLFVLIYGILFSSWINKVMSQEKNQSQSASSAKSLTRFG